MYRTAIIGILGVSLTFLMACEATTGKTTVQSIDDAAVTASVQGKLTADKLSNFSRINVDTERSVVTLNGVVRSVEEKSRAEDLARRTAGVRTVLNNLQIQSLADNVNASTETEAGDKQMNAEVEGEPVTTRPSDQRRSAAGRGRYLLRQRRGRKRSAFAYRPDNPKDRRH